jgi:hypothetical protein
MTLTADLAPGRVAVDKNATRGFIIYLSTLAVLAVLLFVLTATLDWGFFGYLGGAVLLLAGLGGLGGLKKMGGVGFYHCPQCNHRNRVMHIAMGRVCPCAQCATWLEGTDVMTVVAPDRVVEPSLGHPFVAPLLDNAQWPHACPLCNAAATRTVVVEGSLGAAGALVASQAVGVGVYKTYRVEVPACAEHNEPGVGITSVQNSPVKVGVSFRSIRAWRAFCEANQLSPNDAPKWLITEEPPAMGA